MLLNYVVTTKISIGHLVALFSIATNYCTLPSCVHYLLRVFNMDNMYLWVQDFIKGLGLCTNKC